jgi:molecular chaperone HscB
MMRRSERLVSLAFKRYHSARAFSDSSQADDAFRIFDLPHRFSVDEDALKSSYRTLMAEHHPDKDPQNSDGKEAAIVTRAYDLLRHKHTRATHLLEVLGRPLEESSTSSIVGSGFLFEIMELREAVDCTDTDEALRPLWKENQVRIGENCKALSEAIDREDLDEALQLTARLQYWNRIDETIRDKMDSVHD